MKKRIIKRIISLLVVSIITTASISSFAASSKPALLLNGKSVQGDVYIKSNTMYAPLREVCERFGGIVTWDDASKTANIKNISFRLSDGCDINNGRIFAPIRKIASVFDKVVYWSDSEHTAYVNDSNSSSSDFGEGTDFYYTDTSPKSDSDTYEDKYTLDDVYWLSRIIQAEAGAESMEGKIAVGNVIINRVNSDIFPDTIYDVIFDDNYGIQFTPVAIGTIYCEPDYGCIEAAKRALNGENTVGNSLYFFNPELSTSFWIANNCEYVTTIGTHEFYL